MSEDFGALLRQTVEQLSQLFLPNELAFLAATQGLELPLRDKLAFRLHEQLGERYRIERGWRALQFPGAATLAIHDVLGTPRAVLDLRSVGHPMALGASGVLLLQSLSALKDQVPVFTQWYHMFLVHLPQGRLDVQLPGLSLPPTLSMWATSWQSHLDTVQRQWAESWRAQLLEQLGFDSARVSLHILPAGAYYLTRHQVWLFLCGPFTTVDTVYQLGSWNPAPSRH